MSDKGDSSEEFKGNSLSQQAQHCVTSGLWRHLPDSESFNFTPTLRHHPQRNHHPYPDPAPTPLPDTSS